MTLLSIVDVLTTIIGYFSGIVLSITLTGKRLTKKEIIQIGMCSLLLYLGTKGKLLPDAYDTGIGFLIEIIYILSMSYVIHQFSGQKYLYAIGIMFLAFITTAPSTIIMLSALKNSMSENLVYGRIAINIVDSIVALLMYTFIRSTIVKRYIGLIAKINGKAYKGLAAFYIGTSLIPFVMNALNHGYFDVYKLIGKHYTILYILIVTLLIHFINTQKEINKNKEIYVESLGAYNELIESYHTVVRHSKHDFENMMLSYKASIDDGDLDKISELNSQVKKGLIAHQHHHMIDALLAVPIAYLKGVLVRHCVALESDSVTVDIHIDVETEQTTLKTNLMEVSQGIDQLFEWLRRQQITSSIQLNVRNTDDQWCVELIASESKKFEFN